MRPRAALLLAALALACLSCGEKADYDIAEVASDEHLGADHDSAEAGNDHDGLQAAGSETDTGMHLHGAGNRNHGTQWFFNQPWAAPFVWGKMLRDTLILVGLSLVLAFLSKARRPR